jgi:peptidoglycan/LPS O-acetylase OafA/YrhL
MGFYRFVLAIGVVFFHMGDGPWPIGRIAVFCFYFVSGFLICRVLESAYWGSAGNIAAFYCNRALRLLPLYAVISVATVLLLTAHGSNVFPRGPGETVSLLSERLVGGPLFADALPTLHYSDTIPQGWSIGNEAVFYLFAPLLVLLGRRGVWPLAVLAVAATALFVISSLTASDISYVDNVVYKSVDTSAFMFVWGAVVYVLLRDTKFRVPFYVSLPLVALFAYYLYVWAASDELGTRQMTATTYVLNNLLAIPVSALVCFTVVPEALRRWETRVGDLTYGIYLNHFFVAATLLWIAEIYGAPIFGRFNKPEFAVWAVIACVLLALVTLHLVERPIEILRRRIKSSRPSAQTVGAADGAASLAAPAA